MTCSVAPPLPTRPPGGSGTTTYADRERPGELAAREEAVERALVRPRLPRVRRSEHDEVPKLGSGKGAVGGTAIGGPGEEAAVRAQPRLAAGHERALLRLERAEPHGVRDDAHRREPTTRRRREVGNLAIPRAGTFFSGRAEARDPRECPRVSPRVPERAALFSDTSVREKASPKKRAALPRAERVARWRTPRWPSRPARPRPFPGGARPRLPLAPRLRVARARAAASASRLAPRTWVRPARSGRARRGGPRPRLAGMTIPAPPCGAAPSASC